jgi:uncharacterized damage-inducible protein DinB
VSTKLSLDEMKHALLESQQAFLTLIAIISPASLYVSIGDDGWAAGAIMLHISEAREHFAGDINTLVDSNFADKVGRGLTHAGRLAAIESAQKGEVDAAGIRKQLEESYATLTAALDRLSQDDLERTITNRNPKFGAQALWDFIGHFVVEHDANHVKQVQAAIGS